MVQLTSNNYNKILKYHNWIIFVLQNESAAPLFIVHDTFAYLWLKMGAAQQEEIVLPPISSCVNLHSFTLTLILTQTTSSWMFHLYKRKRNVLNECTAKSSINKKPATFACLLTHDLYCKLPSLNLLIIFFSSLHCQLKQFLNSNPDFLYYWVHHNRPFPGQAS